MKNLLLGILSIAIISYAQEMESKKSPKQPENTTESVKNESPQTAEPFAVLELFTSEGCSDCPAAEALLNEIALNAWADREYIHALSFHVDYWNKLGWKDEFSKSEFSDRQRAYRKSFGNEVLYTPQMVVNGVEEFVGSDTSKLYSAIKKALSRQPEFYFTITPNEEWTEITIDPINSEKGNVDRVDQYELNICIVERGLETQIKRGENEGRTLKHENIVRYLSTHNWSNKMATYPIKYRAGFNEKFSIVCFAQHKTSRAIVGANIWNY